jgi:hypothetical protein
MTCCKERAFQRFIKRGLQHIKMCRKKEIDVFSSQQIKKLAFFCSFYFLLMKYQNPNKDPNTYSTVANTETKSASCLTIYNECDKISTVFSRLSIEINICCSSK